MEWLPIKVDRVNWFSTYRVHHRVAERFRKGRAFLLGDAAHVHSPVGGQGMNTGIGDAVNLAWKLAALVHGRAVESILDTYEPERIAFARRLVHTTDRAFTAVTSTSSLARFMRLEVFPRVAPIVIKTRRGRRFMFRTISQTDLNYRGSALSVGSAGAVQGGDRLPWVQALDNFRPLDSLDWQVHVYGDPTPALVSHCAARRLPIHVFAWGAAAGASGLKRDACYLVRPDGYVALADARGDESALSAYLDERRLFPPAQPS
jgi:hypothetical protein